jgi:hypothetical protein
MKSRFYRRSLFVTACGIGAFALSGCSSLGGPASDVGLAAAGGAVGYEVTDHKIGGAAAGAAVGYVASQVAQTTVRGAVREAEQRGYDCAMNQAVKQQYWIIQNQQRTSENADENRAEYVPITLPETTTNGVIHNSTTVYIRVER